MMTDRNTDIIDNCLSLNVSNKLQDRYIWYILWHKILMQYTIKSLEFGNGQFQIARVHKMSNNRFSTFPNENNPNNLENQILTVTLSFFLITLAIDVWTACAKSLQNQPRKLIVVKQQVRKMTILEPFDTLVPRISVTVKKISKKARER